MLLTFLAEIDLPKELTRQIDLQKKRISLQTIHLGVKGSGRTKHSDASRTPKEFDLKSLVAVAQCTGSDQVNGEAAQLRKRLENPLDLGAHLRGVEDPA
jgi:hypothetical protein